MDIKIKQIVIYLYLFILSLFPAVVFAQGGMNQQYNRDTLLTAARNMIKETPFCALVTLDTSGHPTARTMDPFSPDENMVVWLGTNKNSRKAREIKQDSRVTLYYESPNATGYVLIKGNAYLVDDSLKKRNYWKKEWDRLYGDQKSNYILIKIIPDRLEILNFKRGIVGDPDTWTVPFVELNLDEHY